MDFPITSVVFMLVLTIGMFYGQAQYKKKRAEWGKTLTIFCGILIIATALYTNICKSPLNQEFIEIERRYGEVQAIVLANKLANIYKGNGNCLLIHYPMRQGKHLERLKKAFMEGFAGSIVELRAVPIKELPTEEEEEGMMEEEMFEILAEDFNKVINENRDCDMIISMISLPFGEEQLYEMDIFKLIEDEQNPGMYIRDPDTVYPLVGVYNGYIGNLEEFFNEGLIGAMSMWKPSPTFDKEPVPDDIQTAFDKRYLIITPDNIKDIRKTHPKLFPKRKAKK